MDPGPTVPFQKTCNSGAPEVAVHVTDLFVGTRSSVTSTDNQSVAAQLTEIAEEAASIAGQALAQMQVLADRANEIYTRTEQINAELRQFLEQFALEFGFTSSSQVVSGFGGGTIDIEAMRADAAQMAIDQSQARAVSTSLTSIKAVLEVSVDHFSSPSALTRPIDVTMGQIQSAINPAREEQLRRLSREIHDGPAQVLANAIYHVQNVEQIAKRMPESLPEELSRLRDVLKEGVAEVRRFMFDLQPTTLEHYGLGPSIQRYVETFGALRGQKWTCTIANQIPPLTPEQDLAVFRIVQESLQNAQKHAGIDATVEVTMRMIAGTLEVCVRDNGVGFDTALVAPKMTSGAGLMGMRDRASGAHAQLMIESQLGVGTTVTLLLPVDNGPETGTLAVV
jgi:two-component system sensor histidine kinase DegS